jgi:hypothetical protein
MLGEQPMHVRGRFGPDLLHRGGEVRLYLRDAIGVLDLQLRLPVGRFRLLLRVLRHGVGLDLGHLHAGLRLLFLQEPADLLERLLELRVLRLQLRRVHVVLMLEEPLRVLHAGVLIYLDQVLVHVEPRREDRALQRERGGRRELLRSLLLAEHAARADDLEMHRLRQVRLLEETKSGSSTSGE